MTTPTFRAAIAAIQLFAIPASAAVVKATFNSSADVPVTAASYTATGNSVNISLGFAPPLGTNLTVVNNTGLPFIIGQFSNLVQGQMVYLSYGGKSYGFVANYYGGTGNDLVLQWAYQGLAAWGDNSKGQFGNNSTTQSSIPVLATQSGVLAGKTVVSVAEGQYYSLALCSDGTVAAWGDNSKGQLGNNSTTQSNVPVLVTQSGVLSGKTVVSVAAGYQHSLALCSDGTVAAWGNNSSGQLGNSVTGGTSNVPVLVTQSGVLAGKTVVSVAAGQYYSVALCSDGTVAAWGYNGYGQLGNNTTTNSNVPLLVTQSGVLAGKAVISVKAGTNHSLALCSDGTMAAWGQNNYGQLGNNTTTNSSVPVLVTQSGVLAGKTVVSVTTGQIHNLALCSDGTLAAWGDNTIGQLGNNSTGGYYNIPVLVTKTGVLLGKTVVSLAAGSGHSLALCSDGTVTAWGNNNSGQLGNNSTTSSSVPVLVAQSGVLAPQAVVSIAAGQFHTLALAAEQNTSNLFNLTLSSGSLNPVFSATTNTYTSSVTSDTITVTPMSAGNMASLTVNGISVTAGSASQALTLVAGSNTITTVVTAPDGGSTTTYTVTITRFPTLSALVLSSGTLSPTFAAGTTSYTTSVPNATSTITVTPTVTDSTSTVTVNGVTVTSGTTSGTIALAAGTNVITIVVTAQDGTTQLTYKVSVLRISNVATLSGLVLSSGTLNPTFSAGTTSYTASVSYTTFSITVTPTVTDNTATIKVNGVTIASGATSGAIALSVGTNVITTVVTAQDGTTTSTYVLTIDRSSSIIYNSAMDVPFTATSFTAAGPVYLSLGFAPLTGTNLTVVNNTGIGFISGQFSNLVQGQVVNLSFGGQSYRFVANYYGGTGNDLVLQWAYQDLTAWGYNYYGQLGNGSSTNSIVPGPVPQSGVLAGKTVISISAGGYHSLALCSDGTVASWGYNFYGQLGNNSTTNSSVPVLVMKSGVLAGKTVVSVAAGCYHSLALCSDGTVAAWGYNPLGELGNNHWTNSSVPVLVTQSGVLAGKTVVSLVAGGDHSLALCSDGMVAAWGDNTYGQLGNNSTTISYVPVLVTQSGVLADKTVVSMAAGRNHSLVRCSDGTVATWGNNNDGELGNGSFANSNVPMQVTQNGALASKIVKAVTAGYWHNLALCTDGTVVAWGFNGNGELGNNNTTNWRVPSQVNQSGVLAGKAVVSIAGGQHHSLALCSDSTVAAWGDNEYGQFGNNSTTNSGVPVLVTQSTGALAGKTVIAVAAGQYHSLALAGVQNIPDLSGLSLSSGTLTPSFDPSTTAYSASVSNAVSSITVTPTSAVNSASISVNGSPVTSGLASQAIPLVGGTNAITIAVTAPDGVSTKTYTVTVTREAPYTSWISTNYPGLTGANALPTADPDGDGLTNLQEYAFGGDPTASTSTLQYTGTFAGGGSITRHGTPITRVESTTYGVDFRALFIRRKDYAASGLTYTPQFSADLNVWQNSTDTPVVLADVGTWQVCSVPYPLFVSGKKAKFFRISVSMP